MALALDKETKKTPKILLYLYLLVCSVYVTWLKQCKLWKKSAVVDSIVEVSALTYSALPYYLCNLKAVQMNVQHSLFREFFPYELVLGHNATEATKKFYVKGWLDFMIFVDYLMPNPMYIYIYIYILFYFM